jgi:UDP-N-acetylglucosamine 2-epimerase
MGRIAKQLGAVENLPRHEYLLKLATCACAVGNSSSFLIEAPFYGTPVVLVGDRQKGREKAECVVSADASPEQIDVAIAWCASRERMRVVGHRSSGLPTNNPYGDGHASERIVKILEDLDLSEVSVQKVWHE